jgi:hypothetical protein
MLHGSCLCGAVRYQVSGPLTMMAHCHCSMCRKQHGAPFVTFTAADLASFAWLAGQDTVVTFASSASGRRAFCRICGSAVPAPMAELGQVFLFPGGLEGDLQLKPQYHMFVGSKAPWYDITDALPQYEAYPPGVDAEPIDRPRPERAEGVVHGSCLCGEVAYELSGKPVVMRSCHCSRCRRSRAAAHATNLFHLLDGFRYSRGAGHVVDWALPGAKAFAVAFCDRCGSKLPRPYPQRNTVLVPAGGLDDDPGIRPVMHIYTAYKAPWFDITDGLPQHPEGPPPAR